MVAYQSNELIPSSDFAKKFGSYLAQIKEQTLDKVAILKNNHIEAVMVSKEEYERMQEAMELMEHIEIYNIVKERENSKTVPYEEVFAKLGIDVDGL
jgi:PHD/YefM family antitoxin component YafN of YafNO toxin-antitoxin module